MFKRNKKDAIKVANLSCYHKSWRVRDRNLKRYMKNFKKLHHINKYQFQFGNPNTLNQEFFLFLVRTISTKQTDVYKENKGRFRNMYKHKLPHE